MISLRTLPLRSLQYHWLGTLPVLFGVAIGAAVLAGALIVGDSLRGSLRARAERQLQGIDSAWIGTRLVRTETISALPETTPALLLRSSVSTDGGEGQLPMSLAGVTVVGLTDEGLKRFGLPAVSAEGANRVILSARVASRLNTADSKRIRLNLQRVSDVPQSSLLGKRDTDSTTAAFVAQVETVLPAEHPMNDWSLTPSPEPPMNIFVPLKQLQEAVLISGEDRRAIRNPDLIREKINRVNAGFCWKPAAEVNPQFASALDIPDLGLKLRTRRDLPLGKKIKERELSYISVESDRMLLEPAVVEALEKAAKTLGCRTARTTSYLANDIEAAGKIIPYSIVAALDPAETAPLGPFLPQSVSTLADDQIVLVDWPQSPLRGIKPGETVTLRFFRPELETAAVVEEAKFKFAGTIPLGGVAADPNLTPPFPGITDRLMMNDWKPPFPYDNTRIKTNDINDQFWQDYRTTPKAYVNRATGDRLFGSRFGTVTTLRIAPAPGLSLEQTAEKLRAALRTDLEPKALGLQFDSVRERQLTATQGGTDFGMLLLMFSCVLIVSALLLVGLLFRLTVDRRAKEIGLLLATGYSSKQVFRLLLMEGLLVGVVGSALGLLLAVAYADVMIRVLVALWPDNNVGSYLGLHVQVLSLVLGFIGSVLMAVLAIGYSLRKLVKVPPPQLLRGQTELAENDPNANAWKPRNWLTPCFLVLGVVSLLAGAFAPNPDMRAGAFFSGGGLLMLAGVWIFRRYLHRIPSNLIGVDAGLTALGLRSALRNPSRSLLTATLIALSTFLLVAVESFRKKPGSDFLDITGGSGGFRLLAETDVPLFQPLDSDDVRGSIRDELQTMYQNSPAELLGGKSMEAKLDEAGQLLKSLKTLPFRLQGGDDASCLNLYQATQPRVLGVPPELMNLPVRFTFAESEASTPEQKENPWRLLLEERADGAIPVIAEQNTVMWQLKTAVGSEISIPDETGKMVRLRIVGTLQDSLFQSELMISDASFRKLFPRTEGFRYFLIDTPAAQSDQTSSILTNGLRRNGLKISRTEDRVAAYQAVIGAYLSTFQLLGGFGLMLGILGMGVVVLRSVYERSAELALLRCIGFRSNTLQRLVLTENLFLLLAGLGIGVISALLSVLPNLALGGSIPWLRILGLIGSILLTGVIVARVATAQVARMPLVPALRKE